MNEDVKSTAHFGGSLRLQEKAAWPLDWRVVHGVFAVCEFVESGGKGSSVRHTLHIRVEVPGTLPAVAKGIDGICS